MGEDNANARSGILALSAWLSAGADWESNERQEVSFERNSQLARPIGYLNRDPGSMPRSALPPIGYHSGAIVTV